MAKKNGRPLIEIDWKTVENLCSIQCTGEEIAGVLGINYETLERAIKREHKLSFVEYFKKHSSKGKASLRRRQFAMSETNPTMAIWLGKQYLGQTDKVENTLTKEDKLDKVFDKITEALNG